MSQTEFDLLLEEIHEQPGVTQRLLTNQTQAVRDVELSIPATKTVTAQMTLLAMLSAALDEPDGKQFEALAALPEMVRAALNAQESAARLARALAATTVGSVIGRGFAFPPALEIALKLIEGPFIDPEHRGVHDPKHLRSATKQE